MVGKYKPETQARDSRASVSSIASELYGAENPNPKRKRGARRTSLTLRVGIAVFATAFSICNSSSFAAPIAQEVASPREAEDVKPLQGEAKQRALALVRQLGSSDFEARQQATRELWQIGEPALELLENVANGSINREARMRAKDLLSLVKVGVEPDADPEIINCIVGFLDKESIVQDRAVQKLCHLKQREKTMKLIELVPSESDRVRLRKFCSMSGDEMDNALRFGDEPKFHQCVSDPGTRESRKLFYHYYLWVDGKLDAEIDRLKIEVESEITAADKFEKAKKKQEESSKTTGSKKGKESDSDLDEPTQDQLKTLIGLLRFLERWDEASEYAAKVHNKKKRRDLTHTILMESGNWKGLAKLVVDPKELEEANEDGKDKLHDGLAYPAEGYKKALIEYYAGNAEQFEVTISEIEKDIEEEFKKQKQRGAKPLPGNQKHAQFLRYALDFDRALKYTSLKKDRATFRMLNDHCRYKRLFEFFNLDTFEKRARYFEGRARHIRSLQKRVEYYLKEKDEEQREVYNDKRDQEVQNWREVCNLFASLGLNEEAELYHRKLFFDFRDDIRQVGPGVVSDLRAMCAWDSAWELASLECDRNKNFNPLAALLNPGATHVAATLLDQHFDDKIKDRMERCRKVASLVRSPADLRDGQNGEIDFWNEIAEVDLSGQSDAVWHLFLIWNVKEEKLIRKSAKKQSSEPLEQLMKDGDFLRAAEKYEALASNQDNPSNYARAWNAYLRGGDKRNARRMRLLFALKFDPDDAYDYTSGYNGTDWQSLPFDMYRLYDSLENTAVGINCYYMWKIAEDDKKAALSAHQKMVRTQILRLRYIESPYFDGSEKDHPTFIEGALATGDVETAHRWFKKLSTFQPADSGFVEDNFPLLEKIGNKKFVGDMFGRISDDFFEILSMFPDSAMHLNNYAWACANAKQNVPNGIELAKRAVELRPGTAGYFDTLAELYHIDGQNEMAMKTIRRAIEINPMRDYYREQLQKFEEAKASGSVK